jgi:hypothetical protein
MIALSNLRCVSTIGDFKQCAALHRRLVSDDAGQSISGRLPDVVRRGCSVNARADKIVNEKLVGTAVAVR